MCNDASGLLLWCRWRTSLQHHWFSFLLFSYSNAGKVICTKRSPVFSVGDYKMKTREIKHLFLSTSFMSATFMFGEIELLTNAEL